MPFPLAVAGSAEIETNSFTASAGPPSCFALEALTGRHVFGGKYAGAPQLIVQLFGSPQ
jgi:hypothetical protein